jgi:hypothetical protein
MKSSSVAFASRAPTGWIGALTLGSQGCASSHGSYGQPGFAQLPSTPRFTTSVGWWRRRGSARPAHQIQGNRRHGCSSGAEAAAQSHQRDRCRVRAEEGDERHALLQEILHDGPWLSG